MRGRPAAAGGTAVPGAARRRRTLPAGIEVTVSVPATSANLGPGFDTMGLALDLHDEVTVRTVPEGFTARVSGEGEGQVPADGRHLVIATIRSELARAGWEAPGLELTAVNRIPHGRGLGSSAAAHVSAVLAALVLMADTDRRDAVGVSDALNAASVLEGHPDNVAPALGGGLALSWQDADRYHTVRLDPHPDVVPVVAVPSEPLSTQTARGLLPSHIAHADAAANAGRAALLVHALTRDPAVLLPATEDRLHQDFRAHVMPESLELVRRLRAQGLAAVVSGAGPTVMVLAVGQDRAVQACTVVEEAVDRSAQQWRVRILPVDRRGAKVEGHR